MSCTQVSVYKAIFVKQDDKPGYVEWSSIQTCRCRQAQATYLKLTAAICFAAVLLRWGLHMPSCYQEAVASHCPSTLTASTWRFISLHCPWESLHPDVIRHPCPVKPGSSSPGTLARQPATIYPTLPLCKAHFIIVLRICKSFVSYRSKHPPPINHGSRIIRESHHPESAGNNREISKAASPSSYSGSPGLIENSSGSILLQHRQFRSAPN